MQISAPGLETKGAFGRSVSDFDRSESATPPGLPPAEEKLAKAAAAGERCKLGDMPPEKACDNNTIRGSFIRFLLLGGDSQTPVHEKGVLVEGAFVLGDVDLECITVTRPLSLQRCCIQGQLIANDARLGRLDLQGSRITAVTADNASFSGDILLSNRFVAEGEVSLAGAKIEGRLDCHAELFMASAGSALNCGEARIRGSVSLGDGFVAYGGVDLSGADIGGDLYCSGGTFRHRAARTGPDWRDAAVALHLGGANIRGTLWLGRYELEAHGHISMEGSLNLKDAHADRFRTAPESWSSAEITTDDGEKLRCVIELDGFVYNRLGAGSLADAPTCKRWLLRQPPDHLGYNFRPQPFEQLIKVLSAMGYARDARDIAYYKEYRRLRRPWRSKLQRYNPLAWLWWFLRWLMLEKALGHGYRPHRMVLIAIAVLISCGFIYASAAEQGVFVPTNPRVFLDQELKSSCSPLGGKPAWTQDLCQLRAIAPEYTLFNPYIYSLDVILPIVSLRQEDDWQPLYSPFTLKLGVWHVEFSPHFVRAIVWFETLFAWVWSLSLSAVATGIIKRE